VWQPDPGSAVPAVHDESHASEPRELDPPRAPPTTDAREAAPAQLAASDDATPHHRHAQLHELLEHAGVNATCRVCRTLAQLAGTQRSVLRAGSVERAFKARCAELAADAARSADAAECARFSDGDGLGAALVEALDEHHEAHGACASLGACPSRTLLVEAVRCSACLAVLAQPRHDPSGADDVCPAGSDASSGSAEATALDSSSFDAEVIAACRHAARLAHTHRQRQKSGGRSLCAQLELCSRARVDAIGTAAAGGGARSNRDEGTDASAAGRGSRVLRPESLAGNVPEDEASISPVGPPSARHGGSA
jgi:hypothetical protein